MKESYPDDIMLCFVQGFGDDDYKNKVDESGEELLRLPKKKQNGKRVSLPVTIEQSVELRPKKCEALVTGKSLRLSSGELSNQQDVKRSFSDRFSVTDVSRRRTGRGLLTIRKTCNKSRRVSVRQLEILWEFLNINKDIASAYNRSLQAKTYSQRKWCEVTEILNAMGDGVHKDWRGWSKYWVDLKAKLKKRVAAVKGTYNRTGGGPSTEQPLTEIETKFLTILGETFGQGLPGIRVEPFPQTGGTESVSEEIEVQDSPASESILLQLNAAAVSEVQDSPIQILFPMSPLAANPQPPHNITRTPSPNPHRLSTPAPSAAAAAVATSSPRRRRRRREPPMTQEAARRALVQSSQMRAEASLRSSVALERIAQNTQDIQDVLQKLERSTGNFASGAAGGGCGAPRSAPATPLQLEPQPRTKHDKQVLKPLSGSAPSVRVAAHSPHEDTKDGKQPSKSRQKKFYRHFPQVGPEERVLNYYSCALVGDILLQGHLYITKNYFAFYSNVFGYVTKLLIPTTSILRITKEKVARIIPNAVGVCTRDERHVFGSLLSRDSTYKLMTHVWKAARAPELATPKPDLRASEVELDASEYSPEDDSSSAGGDHVDAPTPPVRRESDAIIPGAAVIQPALLTGGAPKKHEESTFEWWRTLMILFAALLTISASFLAYKLYLARTASEEELSRLSGEELYSELVQWRTRLHGRAAGELHAFLSTNLLLLTKVRQSLEALSGVILTDIAHNSSPTDVPNETVFS